VFVPILGEADVGSGREPGTSALYQAKQNLFSHFHENSKKLFITPELCLSALRPNQKNRLVSGKSDQQASDTITICMSRAKQVEQLERAGSQAFLQSTPCAGFSHQRVQPLRVLRDDTLRSFVSPEVLS
jgi:hypothetical protein